MDPKEILKAQPQGPDAVAALFLKQAEELYRVREVEYLVGDRRGFWEERGYHNRADPWQGERYSYQE